MGEFASFRDAYYTWDDKTDYLVLSGKTVIGLPDAFYCTGKRLEQAGWNLGRLLNSSASTGTPDAPLFAETVSKYGYTEANSHSGPVYWYSETTRACNDGNGSSLSGLGFASSILYREPSARIDSITPSTAQPPADSITFQGSGTVNGGTTAGWEWSSSVDGILGTSPSFTKSSRELTVGGHTIAFRVRDNQGNWSDSVSANITVNNALPTATLSGIPDTPVFAGAVLNLSLGGQDNDENGQSIVAGELSVSGNIVATALGAYSLTVPTQAGDYTVSYRVRDDEGTWSPPVSKTLTVQPPPDTQGPVLNVTSPANGITLNNSTLTVSGNASDSGRGNNGVSSVSVNGVPASGGSAAGANTADWSVDIALAPGQNTITVVAKDSFNNATTQQLTVNYVPTTGMPVLIGTRQGSQLVLRWSTNDPAYSLEYATNMTPSGWLLNPTPPSIVDGQYTITDEMTNFFRAYRLKK